MLEVNVALFRKCDDVSGAARALTVTKKMFLDLNTLALTENAMVSQRDIFFCIYSCALQGAVTRVIHHC